MKKRYRIQFSLVFCLSSMLLLGCSSINNAFDGYPDLYFTWRINTAYDLLIVNDTHERIHVELSFTEGPILCELNRKSKIAFFLKANDSRAITFSDESYRSIRIYAETLDWASRTIRKGGDEHIFTVGESHYEILIQK